MKCIKCQKEIGESNTCPYCRYEVLLNPEKELKKEKIFHVQLKVLKVCICLLLIFVVTSIFAIMYNSIQLKVNAGRCVSESVDPSTLVKYSVLDSITLKNNSSWHIIEVLEDDIVLLSDDVLDKRVFCLESPCLWDNSNIKEYLDNEYLQTSQLYTYGDALKLDILSIEQMEKLVPFNWLDNDKNETENILSSVSYFDLFAHDNEYFFKNVNGDKTYVLRKYAADYYDYMKIESINQNESSGIRLVATIDKTTVFKGSV